MTYHESLGIDRGCEVVQQKKTYLVDGNEYSRVTSVLRVINKPLLYYWYGKHGTQKCKQISLESRTRGTLMHKLIEKVLMGEEITASYSPDATERLIIFNRWKETHNIRDYTLEETLFSHKMKVAGTCDFVGHIDNELAVADWKSSKDIYPENPLQISAYMHMLYEMTGRKPQCGYVVAFKEDGLYKEMPVSWEQSKIYLEGFEAALKLYLLQQNPPDIICEEG